MTETKTVERDMSVFTKQTMKNGIVKDKPGRRKLFAQYNETATATYDELHARPLNRVYQEREPELRQQRVLETRSWHDPQQNDLSHSRGLRKTSDGLNHPSGLTPAFMRF
jgi:hypothetical protein